jgi:hypothetical protein
MTDPEEAPVAAIVWAAVTMTNLGSAAFTVRVKDWVALEPTPFVAVMVIGKRPVPAPGLPASTPAEVSVTPEGRAPVSEKVGTGKPVAVTVKVSAEPTLKVVLDPLVIAGA